jgi:Holliday junction resolvase RusA-like endonuclease
MVSLTNVAFQVPGEPQGKGRARIVKIGGVSRMATPGKTVAYEGLIAMAAKEAMGGTPPFPGACSVSIVCNHTVPASWSKKKRAAAHNNEFSPTCKPDLDNVAKAVGDGCTGVVWVDDKQIAALVITRRYAAMPGLWVTVAHQHGQAPQSTP